jgi:hypothetical protein
VIFDTILSYMFWITAKILTINMLEYYFLLPLRWLINQTCSLIWCRWLSARYVNPKRRRVSKRKRNTYKHFLTISFAVYLLWKVSNLGDPHVSVIHHLSRVPLCMSYIYFSAHILKKLSAEKYGNCRLYL